MNNYNRRQLTQGFTLIELMIVIAIVGILSAIAVPLYGRYIDRAKFSDVVLAVGRFKAPAEVAYQVVGLSVAELDSGSYGIPSRLTNTDTTSPYINSIEMQNGKIIAQATAELNNATITILATPSQSAGGIIWNLVESESSCITYSMCSAVR